MYKLYLILDGRLEVHTDIQAVMKKGVAYLNVTSFHRLKSETKRLKKNCEVIAKT